MKYSSRRKTSNSLREKYPNGLLLPDSEIQELVFNLRVGEVHAAGMYLLVIGEAVRAIVEDKTARRETNVRLIKNIESEEECRPIQRLIKAITDAIEQGAEGIYAACLTITRFLEVAFDYSPDHRVASRLYKNRLSKLRPGPQMSG